jgi:elongation factor Ts
MAVAAADVKKLREMTGAGPLDCKKALEETNGDLDKAATWLREKGIAKAQKKLGKEGELNEGIVEVYQHFTNRLAVIVEVNCQTDFVANTEKFRTFAKDLALHIVGLRPKYVTREEVPAAVLQAEKDAQLRMEDIANKPDNIKEKIVEGRLDKWYQEIVLMEQAFFKNEDITIQQLLENVGAEIGEKVQIRRFARYELGEFASEAEGDEDYASSRLFYEHAFTSASRCEGI